MQNPTATLYCPQPSCQTVNPEGNRFCLKCGSFLPRQYLWALDKSGLGRVRPGETIGDRYVLKTGRILLDTRPGLLPDTPQDILPQIAPYLKLFAYRIHVPQIYGRVSIPSQGAERDIWLLEHAPISQKGEQLSLYPTLSDAWHDASPMRQLNWLWQIANLWSPFLQVGVASSLLNPELLRVEGATVRLLELTEDDLAPTLRQLGQFWLGWVERTEAPIKHFVHRLCQLLIEGQVRTIEQSIALLDRGLAVVGRSQSRRIERVTLSDRGPSRTRNEDSCYPPSGVTPPVTAEALAIVCDGVGGHEGGDVASQIAIEAISDRLEPFLNSKNPVGVERLYSELEQSIYDANNAISAQNNNEQRLGRQRMGTTVALGLTQGHQFYITHVGDSRAYRITPTDCHQLTLDDDVASREVRLGYALYRNALQQVAAGSLVQAIGMGSSNTLYPNINRSIVDEDSLFLLCSDGLSDYDRVDQYWQEELLPVLEGKIPLGEAAQKLVSIANTLNGHDNVTVVLIRIQVKPAAPQSISADLLLNQLDSIPAASSSSSSTSSWSSPVADADQTQDLPTQIVVTPSRSIRSSSLLPLALAFLAGASALAGIAGFAYFQQPTVRAWVNDRLGRQIDRSPTTIAADPPSARVLALNTPDLIRLQTGTQLWKVLGERTKGFESVPADTLLQVVNKQAIKDELWLAVNVCSLPETATPTPEKTADAAQKTDSDSTEDKANITLETPSPAATSKGEQTQDPPDTKASASATLTAEPKPEPQQNAQPTPPASQTPPTREPGGETPTLQNPSPSPSGNGNNATKEAPIPKQEKLIETFWIVGAELDRSGFEPVAPDIAPVGNCQSPTSRISDDENP